MALNHDRAVPCAGHPVPNVQSASTRRGRHSLVLVVEDDPDCRAIYRLILQASGYAVIETADGTDALRLAGECAPDLILMDLGVPGTDGWMATRLLRQRRETAAIPVVVLTAHVLPEHEARAWDAGCVAFLAKPIEPKAIVAEIRRILEPAVRS